MCNKTVLVIEDEVGVSTSIEMMLEDFFRVLIAPTAEAGLSILNAEPGIALVLLDIKLPDQDGVSLIPQIKALQPEIKIAVITACRVEEIRERAEAHQIDDYLTKPFSVEDFRARVHALIHEKKE